MSKCKSEYRLVIRDHRGAALMQLVVTDDRWILGGHILGPETCAVLDAIALTFHSGEFDAAADLGWFLSILLYGKHSFGVSQFVPLVRWIRDNFDYPSGGRA